MSTSSTLGPDPLWAPLLPLAMVGTDRHSGPSPQWPGEVGALATQAADAAVAAGAPAATAALRMAGVLAACAQAGSQGLSWAPPLPAAAAADAQAEPGSELLQHVDWALREGPARLLHAVCQGLGAAGLRLPPALLPVALEQGRRSAALRAPLAALLGARGRWLATQHEAWGYAVGGEPDAPSAPADARLWLEGSFEQRRAWLSQQRAADPAAAREHLARALPELPARERAELLPLLADGLGPEDESLLDELFQRDRGREVRQAALALLLRLPGSAHVARAAARVAPLLTRAPSGLPAQLPWQLEAPTEAAPAWKAAQIELTRPQQESLGERGWWLYQLVRQVPLSWWRQQLGMAPPALLKWAAASDWAEALLRGWREVLLMAAHEPEWTQAWLARDSRIGSQADDTARLLALLPRAERERHWARHLADGAALDRLVQDMLLACPAGETWSAPLSHALVQALLPRLQHHDALAASYTLRAQLPEICCALHGDALPALAALPRHADETASLGQALDAATQIITTRQALDRTASAPPTSSPTP